MSTYDGYGDGYDDQYDDEEAEPQEPVRRGRPPGGATPLGAGLGGLLIGALLAGIALAVIGGNPFSDANDVTYREIVVADISGDNDSICWSQQPGRRDAPQDCAILALDPAAAPPEEGERVTIGVVRLVTPSGDSLTQVVYVRGGSAEAPAEGGSSGEDPAEDGTSGEADADADADADAEAPAS